MQICWSCKLRACDAKSLRILVPSREDVILDLQRSRQKDPIANQQLLSYFFGLRNCPSQSLYCSILELLLHGNFRAVCISLSNWHPLDSKQLRPWCLSYFRAFLFPLSLEWFDNQVSVARPEYFKLDSASSSGYSSVS